MKIKEMIIIAFAVICSFLIVLFTDNIDKSKNPMLAYRIYLEGEDIGLIESKKELEDYINKQENKLKDKFNVNKIYIPNEIDIVRDVTYDNRLSTVSSIYNKINDISPFTIKGYEITIDKTNSLVYKNDDNVGDSKKIIKIYVLDKTIFEKAVEDVVLSFISKEDYDKFLTGTQKDIETTGQLIENIFIDDDITIKETYIRTTEKIYTDQDALTKYLIFGDHSNNKKYIVKEGDTIPLISDRNKMSVNELLIANSDAIKSESSLIYTGQELHIGTLNPIFTTVLEKHVVTDQVIKYKTVYRYDNNMYLGDTKTIQKGVNGVTRVTQKVKMVNGQIMSALIAGSEVITPTVEKIVIKGGRQPIRGDGEWVWPTNIPYIISSYYGWRWGQLHRGVDICGTGFGSPIYAARSGVITRLGWYGTGGYFVEIRHDNGYYSHYLHLANSNGNNLYGFTSSAAKYVKVGDYVKAGTVIGDMGSSGYSTGTHLHFGIWSASPYSEGSQSFNPLLFY